jgi:uncharacterized membrane protein
MNKGLILVGGMGLGAALMYLLDPDAGKRRRAVLRDKAGRAASQAREALAAAGQDLVNRATGLAAQARGRLQAEEAPDAVLVERVRSQIGRLVRHPRSVEVSAQQGRVTLTGPVLADEAEALRAGVAAVPGVRGVADRLEVHGEPGGVPGLQGAGKTARDWTGWPSDWPPSVRLLAALAGTALTAYGVSRRSPLACVAGAAGLGLLARGLTNTPVPCLVGVGDDCPSIKVEKTVTLDAPVERVFEFWANYENFPRFMTHVRQVKDLGEGRSHWVVSAPGGLSLEWNAVLTELVPDEVIAWKSEPGALVSHGGTLRFEPQEGARTRVHISMSYTPPAGVLGHLVAALFGSDPKRKMDEDLLRMKTLVETGQQPHDAAEKLPVEPPEDRTARPDLLPLGPEGSGGAEARGGGLRVYPAGG